MDPVAPAPTAHPHPISHPPPSRVPQSALQPVEGPLRSALGTLGGLLSGLPDLRIPLSSTPTASSWLLNTYLGAWVGGPCTQVLAGPVHSMQAMRHIYRVSRCWWPPSTGTSQRQWCVIACVSTMVSAPLRCLLPLLGCTPTLDLCMAWLCRRQPAHHPRRRRLRLCAGAGCRH